MRLYIKGCVRSKQLRDAILEPYDEVWTLNNQLGRNYDREWDKTPTAHFSLHGLKHEIEVHGERYLEYLSNMPWTVYLWRDQIYEWPKAAGDVPLPANVAGFPLSTIEEALGRRYFTGSFAYMLAFALWLHRFDEVHIVGTDFNSTDLWDARLQAADWIWALRTDEIEHHLRSKWGPSFSKYARKIEDHLRGQMSGDESWARECMMYWIGRLEQAGTKVITGEDPWLFDNKWLRTHAADCQHDDVRGLYGLDPCIGG